MERHRRVSYSPPKRSFLIRYAVHMSLMHFHILIPSNIARSYETERSNVKADEQLMGCLCSLRTSVDQNVLFVAMQLDAQIFS